MKKQTLVSLIVSAAVLLAGSAGSYAIHHSYSTNGGEGALLAANSPGTETTSGETASSISSDTASTNTGGEEPGTADAASGDTGKSDPTGQQSGEKDVRTLKEIISSVGEKVVMIETADGSIGSGFLYNDRGDILTNAHVVAGFTDVTVTTSGSKEMSGTVIGIGEETDVAVVRVADLEGVEPLELKLQAEAEIGDEVLALGSPLGLQNTVTTGIVSGVDRTFDIAPYYYEGLYQISAPIAPGNSGGPLVDRMTGQVLGINSAVTDEGGIGFSIPVISIVDSARSWSDDPMDELPTPKYGRDDSGVSQDDYGIGEENGSESEDGSYNGTDLEYEAEDMLYMFYDAVAVQDYRTAYELLSPEWQKKQSYEKFESGYKDTLGVYLDYCVGVENMDGTVSVYVSITADERGDNGAAAVVYDLVYQVGYGTGSDADVLQILSGKSQ